MQTKLSLSQLIDLSLLPIPGVGQPERFGGAGQAVSGSNKTGGARGVRLMVIFSFDARVDVRAEVGSNHKRKNSNWGREGHRFCFTVNCIMMTNPGAELTGPSSDTIAGDAGNDHNRVVTSSQQGKKRSPLTFKCRPWRHSIPLRR